VHQHTRAFKVQFFGTHHARQENQAHMSEPARVLNAGIVTRLAAVKQQLALTVFVPDSAWNSTVNIAENEAI